MSDESKGWPVEDGVLRLGDLPAERGGVIRDARLVWQAHGTLNDARDNVIVYPCSYTATHEDLAWLIGPDAVLDPARWFIVIPDMFSNGLSSGAADTPDYPAVVTMADNVRAQHRLLTEHFGVTRVAAAYGFSMGAGQAYHWAALFADFVERAIVVCGSARTSVHNKVFLSGLLRTLEAAPEYQGNGRFSAEPLAAIRAFAHIYAGWGLSQDFYRERLFETALGAARPGHLPQDRLGGLVRRVSGRQPLRPGAHLAGSRHQRQRPVLRRPGQGARRRSRPGCCSCRARPTCTSGWPITRQNCGHLRQRHAGHDSQHLGPPGRQPGGHPGRPGIPDQPGPVLAGPLTRVAAWQRGHLPWQEPSWRPRRRIKICSVASQPCPLRSAG